MCRNCPGRGESGASMDKSALQIFKAACLEKSNAQEGARRRSSTAGKLVAFWEEIR